MAHSKGEEQQKTHINKKQGSYMDDLVSRERALEMKFQHEQFLEYKVLARRNRLFGLWAAHLLGLEQAEADTYARGVVSGKLCTPGGEELLERILTDTHSAGLELSLHLARKQLEYCHKDAAHQIYTE